MSSRIGTQIDFGTSFKKQQTGGSFKPVKAVDESKAIKERTKAKVEDIKTEARSQARQDKVNLAVFKAGQAKQNAFDKQIQGVLSLSQTGIKAYREAEKIKAEKDLDDEAFKFLIGPEDKTTAAIESAEVEDDKDLTIQAGVEQQIPAITDNPNDQELIRQEGADKVAIKTNKKINLNELGMEIQPFLADFKESDFEVQLPDGRVIKARDAANSSEALHVLKVGLWQFSRENNLSSQDASALRKGFKPQVDNAIRAVGAQWYPQIREANQNARLETAQHWVRTANVGDEGYSQQDIWTQGTKMFLASGKYKGRTEANAAFIKFQIKEAIANGDVNKLKELELAVKDPTKKNSPTVGSTYKSEIEDGIRKIKGNTLYDLTIGKKFKKAQVEDTTLKYQEALSAAKTDEERKTIHETYEQDLLKIGGTNARTAYLAAVKVPNTYNPNLVSELQTQIMDGAEISSRDIDDALNEGKINKEERDALVTLLGDDDPVKIKEAAKPYKDSIEKSIKGAVNTYFKSEGLNQISENEAFPIVDDMKDALTASLGRWILENPKANKGQIEAMRNTLLDQLIKQKLPKGKAKDLISNGQVTGQYNFNGARTWYPDSVIKQPETGRRILTNIKTAQIRALAKDKKQANDVNPAQDQLFVEEELKAAYNALVTGQPLPQKVKDLAEALGITPYALLDSQHQVVNQENLDDKVNLSLFNGDANKFLVAQGFTEEGAKIISETVTDFENIENAKGWLKINRPEAYRILTNPNSTPAQLERARLDSFLLTLQ